MDKNSRMVRVGASRRRLKPPCQLLLSPLVPGTILISARAFFCIDAYTCIYFDALSIE